MAKAPRIPIPETPNRLTYWVLAAIGGAIAGGLIYSFLDRNQPF